MKFGVYLPTQYARGSDYAQRFAELADLVALVERAGFDSIWAGEHHMSADAFFPPLMTLAAVAGLTKKITLGSAILVLPLYNPVRLAEDVAMLSVVSRGRVVLGVGVGYRREEYGAFSVPFNGRTEILEEQIPLLRRLWRGSSTTASGKWYSLREVRVNPRPIGAHVPVWIGVTGAASAEALDRVARIGDAWLLDAATPLTTYQSLLPRFLALLNKYHKSAERVEFPVLRDVYVARDASTAEDDVGEAVVAKYREYFRWGYPVVRKGYRSEEDITFKSLARDVIIIGSPDDCISQIERYSGAGINHLILRIRLAGMTHIQAKTAAELFASKIMPHFKGPG